MRWISLYLIFLLCLLFPNSVSGQAADEPQANLRVLFLELAKKYIPSDHPVKFEFRCEENRFGHLTRPWETSSTRKFGMLQVDQDIGDAVRLQETVERASGNRVTTTTYSDGVAFQFDADNRPVKSLASDNSTFLRKSCRYSPSILLRHIAAAIAADDGAANNISVSSEGGFLLATGAHGNEDFAVRFSIEDTRLKRISWMRYHEFRGDQLIELSYENDNIVQSTTYPGSIVESTFNTTTFETQILSAEIAKAMEIEVPDDVNVETTPEEAPSITVEAFSDRISFLTLEHTQSRTTLVEFDEFLMVIDAPVESSNGQLILDTIGETKPGKPVKYFAFGHHHPHYLGGFRPFVAAGATILTTTRIVPYLKQLAGFQHARNPDSLQSNPKELVTQSFEGRTIISDGNYSVEIYDIGMESKHTIDYLLFYFPAEKMMLQGDGIWLRPDEPASERTRAIYDSVAKLDLDVVDCIQGWPTHGYGVPTKVKFSELEGAVIMHEQNLKLKNKETFEKLQSLVGDWKRVDENKVELVNFRLSANNSVLVETWTWPDREIEALTIYHMDGDKLMATHYCPIGNQPRLLFDADGPGEKLVFKFDSATDLDDRTQSHCIEFWVEQKSDDLFTRSETYTEADGVDVGQADYVRVKE